MGTRPLVHVGFLKSWLAGGLHCKVVNQVVEAVQQCKDQSKSDHPITVFVTGMASIARQSVCAAVHAAVQVRSTCHGACHSNGKHCKTVVLGSSF